MKLKICQKNILSMLVIVVVGFILFYIAFILAYIISRVYQIILMPFAGNLDNNRTIRFSWHYVNIFVVLLISWFVFKTKLNDLAKATFSAMPLIVLLTELGIQFYQQPALGLIIGAVSPNTAINNRMISIEALFLTFPRTLLFFDIVIFYNILVYLSLYEGFFLNFFATFILLRTGFALL